MHIFAIFFYCLHFFAIIHYIFNTNLTNLAKEGTTSLHFAPVELAQQSA